MGRSVIKRKLKQILGERHYWSLVRARHSKAVRTTISLASFPLQKALSAKNQNFFAANICAPMGYGAILTHLLRITKYAHDKDKIPHVIATSRLYSARPHEDCIAPYIKSKKIDAPLNPDLYYLPVANEQSLDVFGVPQHMSLLEANALFEKYYEFEDSIKDRIDNFMRKEGVKDFDLSIHYRCTDKQAEAPTVSVAEIIDFMTLFLNNNNTCKNIFVASDNSMFIEEIKEIFRPIRLTSYQLGSVTDGEPRHFSDLPNDDKAIEAIVNMILLSKSKLCIRTASYLSAWSKILNPSLKTITLNKTFEGSTHFPEHEICASEC